jgi:hypothetical protein
MVFNATFNNISVISLWTGFEFTTLVVIGTDCKGSCKSNYHTITTTGPRGPLVELTYLPYTISADSHNSREFDSSPWWGVLDTTFMQVHQWLAACWWYSPGTVKLVFNSCGQISGSGPQWFVYYCYRKAFYWKTWQSLCTDPVFL